MNHSAALATSADRFPVSDAAIAEAAGLFWGVISAAFPEMKTGDSALSGEDEAALATWANGSPGERPVMANKPSAPAQIALGRVEAAVTAGMHAAATRLFSPRLPTPMVVAVYEQLAGCVRHHLHYNVAPLRDGWFEVDAYDTEASWHDGKDPGHSVLGTAETLAGAIDMAKDDRLDNCYQVVARAFGEHDDYEPGETVYTRFDRTAPSARPPRAGM